MGFKILADAVLVLHFGTVLFVIGGLVLIVVGNRIGWSGVNRWGFRLAHLAAIAVVTVQSWLGVDCPLTTLESWLRMQAGASGYQQGFIEHWVQRLLYYQAPGWIFVAAYTLFGVLVVSAWWYFPPQRRPPRR